MSPAWKKSCTLVLTSVLFFLLTGAVRAQGAPTGDAIMGGLLYDSWFDALDIEPPDGNHPLWANQSTNRRQGSDTWRCAECHGWDYKGAEGQFGGGEHYTGFPGLLGMIGSSNEEVMAWLDGTNDRDHDFSLYMGQYPLNDLVAFIRTKMVDVALLVDYDSGAALGDKSTGFVLYNNSCAECHGEDGSQLNFGVAQSPYFIADKALDDPWRFVHSVRFGVPATDMPAAEQIGWTLQDVAAVVAYAQVLPPARERPSSGADALFDIEDQGAINPIIAMSAIIMLVVFAGLTWATFVNRRST